VRWADPCGRRVCPGQVGHGVPTMVTTKDGNRAGGLPDRDFAAPNRVWVLPPSGVPSTG